VIRLNESRQFHYSCIGVFFQSVVLLVAFGLPLGCAPKRAVQPLHTSPEATAPLAVRMTRALSDAIRIRSVNPPGREGELADYYVRLLAAAGLETQVVPTPASEGRGRRAAAWARLPGRGLRPPLVLLSHLDVVAAQAEEWQRDPFGGEVFDGFVHGRGALDAKGVSIVHLFAMAELARRGLTLDRDLLFLATPDEESGGLRGAGYIAENRTELLRGARDLLTEGGSVLLGTAKQPPRWLVSVTEKSPCWVRVTARGESGHSSVPRRGDAVERLLRALLRVREYSFPQRVTPETAAMFRTLEPLADAEDRSAYRDIARAIAEDPAFRLRFLAVDAQRALVQNTLAITVLRGSPRTNVLAPRAVAHLDLRLLPGESCDEQIEVLLREIADPAVALEPILAFPSRTSPSDTPLFRAISRVAVSQDPHAIVVPQVTAGFTDAHYFRSLGLVAYGFTPRWNYAGEHLGVHGHDERISTENLERGVETLIQILLELDALEK
jgi:acetylornithine deacetylase/succinyl-diaminopimelate desuccinylase-like protein